MHVQLRCRRWPNPAMRNHRFGDGVRPRFRPHRHKIGRLDSCIRQGQQLSRRSTCRVTRVSLSAAIIRRPAACRKSSATTRIISRFQSIRFDSRHAPSAQLIGALDNVCFTIEQIDFPRARCPHQAPFKFFIGFNAAVTPDMEYGIDPVTQVAAD